MKDLLIIGTAGHALEIIEIVERINRIENKWNICGLVDRSGKRNIGEELNGYPVLGNFEIIDRYPHADLVKVWRENEADIPAERFVTIIDPSTFVSRTASIGSGCIIYPGCYIGLNARLGDFVLCLSGSIINHDDVIEDKVKITSGVTLGGNVHIETGCYLGQSSTCRQNLKIGRNSLIGMGSVVIKDVPENVVMVGNPAYKLRDNV